MQLIALSKLRHFGIGDESACLSRGGDVVAALARDAEGAVAVSLDAVSVVAAVLSLRPEMEASLHERVRGGTLRLAAAWSACWHNVPEPEDIVRNLRLAQAWTSSRLGQPSSVAILPGTLDQGSEQLPQLLKLAGVGSVVFEGGESGRYRWAGIDGTEVSAWVSPEGASALALLSDNAGEQRQAMQRIGDSGAALMGEEGWVPPSDAHDRIANFTSCHPDFLVVDEVFGASADRCLDIKRSDVLSPEVLFPGIVCHTARVSRDLVATEAVLAAARSHGREPEPVDDLWKCLLEVCDGAYAGTADSAKTRAIQGVCAALAGELAQIRRRAQRWVAERVALGEGPDGTLPIVVFNPTGRCQSQVVEVDVLFYGEERLGAFERYEYYRIVDADGTPVDVEEVGGRQIQTAELTVRFVATDVPACGYRTYYLVPKPARPDALMPIQQPGAMVPDFPEPTFAVEDVEDRVSPLRRGIRVARTFKVRHALVEVNEVSGSIAVIDRKSGHPLVDRIAVEAAEDALTGAFENHHTTGRRFEMIIDSVDLSHSGSVSATLSVAGRIQQSEASLNLTVYDGLPWLDVEVAVTWDESTACLVQACFDRRYERVIHGVPFGSVASGREEGAGARTVHGWIALEGDPSLVIASDRRSFRFAPGGVRADLLVSTIDPASYAYHRVWRRPAGRQVSRFRLLACDAERVAEEGAWTAAALHQPLATTVVYDRRSKKSLPSSASTVSLEGPGIVTSAVRPCDGGLELRAYEVRGAATNGRLVIPDGASVDAVDVCGVPLGPVDPGSVAFHPYEIRTLRVRE